MNIETLELDVVAKATESEGAIELLALSIDDLDLVAGGGGSIGALI